MVVISVLDMAKVYVICFTEPQESECDVIEIFSTREAAQEYLKTNKYNNSDNYYIKEMEVLD